MDANHFASTGAADWLTEHLEKLTPDHISPAWVAARSRACAAHSSFLDRVAETPSLPPPLPPTPPQGACRVTVGITTCRRLELFKVTARSLLDSLGDLYQPAYQETASSSPGNSEPLVCRIIVVVDGSPA